MTLADHFAERAVLGSMMLDREAVLAGVEMLRPEDFDHGAHRAIFAAAAALLHGEKEVDLVSLSGLLSDRQQLQAVGGQVALMRLPEAVPSAANVEHWAGIVRGKSRLRAFSVEAQRLAKEAHDTEDPDDFLDRAQGRLLSFAEDPRMSRVLTAPEVAKSAYEDLERRMDSGQAPGLDVGFHFIENLGGLKHGGFVVVAGRPGMGKTAKALNWCVNAARAGKRVLFLSMEMQESELMARILANMARVPLGRIMYPATLSPDGDLPRIAKALGEFSEFDFHLWCTPSTTANALRIRALRLHAQRPVDLVVSDYLGLFEPDGTNRFEGRQQEMANVSRVHKKLAMELGAPVVGLSQLNRELEKRSDKVPVLSDLRESGAIEQDADMVVFLYRPCQYFADADPNLAEVHVAKNRHGNIGHCKLRFDGPYQCFSDEGGY